MSFERSGNAVIGFDPKTGKPARVTNMRDVVDDVALPDPLAFIDTGSPCQTHGAPPITNPYNPATEEIEK